MLNRLIIQRTLKIMSKKSYSIFDVIKDTVKGNVQKSDATIISDRIAVCNICPELKKPLRICGKCGCQVDAKVKYKLANCPIGKW